MKSVMKFTIILFYISNICRQFWVVTSSFSDHDYLSQFSWREISILPVQWHALCLGLFASIIAPFGGFFASGFKRAFNIKV